MLFIVLHDIRNSLPNRSRSEPIIYAGIIVRIIGYKIWWKNTKITGC